MAHPLLALADVHRLTTEVRGRPLEAYLFDHHRSAFAVWCHTAATLGAPLTLVTLDRHMDLGTPAAAPPDHRAPLAELDQFARHRLAPANDDHVVAALEAGALADVVVVARSHAPPSLDRFRPYRDARGGTHRFAFARAPAALGPEAFELIREAKAIVLDVDLDCFTTLSDGHPDEVLGWDSALIDSWLRPPGSGPLWDELLARVSLVTVAREPYHCGGFDRGARLWLAFSGPFFQQLLGTDPP